MGYNAVIVVKADSPYKTIEDLKGKVVARTDPLSGSGYLIPTAAFRAMGKPVDEYYKSPLSGGHPQAVLGVLRGTYDGAFTWTRRTTTIGNLRADDEQGAVQARADPHRLDVAAAALAAGRDPQGPAARDARRSGEAVHPAQGHDMTLAEAVAQGKTNGHGPR